jgi:hypothetical protein
MRLRLPQCWPRLLLYGPFGLVAAAFLAYLWGAFHMPGRRHRGPLPPLTEAQRGLSRELGASVTRLATDIGERRVGRPGALGEARAYIEAELGRAGYSPRRQEFFVRGVGCANVEATLSGSDRAYEIVVIGAHYDSAPGTSGADDNASGVAALLALARRGVGMHPRRTVRFVAFVNEEPPFFRTANMGSVRYAREASRRGERIVTMLSLESLGYYSDQNGSQQYPFPLGWFYPSVGDFVAFVGKGDSQALVRRATGAFRRHMAFPALGAAIPGAGTGADLSDHWAFSQIGVPALMVTDTAMLRSPHYHRPTDTAETIDYERLSRVVDGLTGVVAELANTVDA